MTSLALLAVLMVPLQGQAPVPAPSLTPGDHRFTLTFDGRMRRYIVHVPPATALQAVGGRPLAVVVSFHGGGGSAAGHQADVRTDEVADSVGFLVVYPDGTGRSSERLLTWNAGTCCGYARDHQVDDVGFTRALLDDLARRIPIDAARVYAAGHSNGAMMAYRLAAEASDRIAAIAAVSGGMVVDSIRGARAVPIIHLHSVDDPRALYGGGLGPPFPLTNSRVRHPAVERVLAAWAAHDGCPAQPAAGERVVGGDGEGQTAVRLVYAPCRDGAEIVHWRFTRVGHTWPGGRAARGRRMREMVGPPAVLLDASRELWRFVSRFSLPAAAR